MQTLYGHSKEISIPYNESTSVPNYSPFKLGYCQDRRISLKSFL